MRAVLYVLIFSLVFPALAFAEGTLPRFHAITTDVREHQVVSMLSSKTDLVPDLPFVIASIDLNGDGVDEWVVRQDGASNCVAQVSCQFFVAGLSAKQPVLLGQFQAGKIAVLDERIYGVNKIAVYNDQTNDYKFQPYGWAPKSGSFRSIYPLLRSNE